MRGTRKVLQERLDRFKHGVADALLNGRMNEERQSSFYYKQGYDFGLVMWNELDESDNNDEDFSSIREK
jgi:hypothetical protein